MMKNVEDEDASNSETFAKSNREHVVRGICIGVAQFLIFYSLTINCVFLYIKMEGEKFRPKSLHCFCNWSYPFGILAEYILTILNLKCIYLHSFNSFLCIFVHFLIPSIFTHLHGF